MLPNKYSQNGKNKSNGNETLGIVFVIVFSFLLLCSLTGSLLLGDIGLAIKNISLGLLGYFAYPVFLFCIILGVFMLQHKKLSVSPRNLVSLIIIFFCTGMIIHLATTTAYMTDFGGYIDHVFHGATIGGVLMGLFAFPLKSAFTAIGAYIFFGCIILVFLLLVAGFFDKNLSFGNIKKAQKTNNAMNKIKGGTTFVGNGGDLFIEKIIPPDAGVSTPGSFDDLPDETEKYMDRPAYAPGEDAFSPEIQKMRRQQDEYFDEIYKKSRAHQILFENKNPDEIEKTDRAPFPSYNNGTTTEKRNSSSKGWDDIIVMPPPKDIKSRFVSGAIINGETTGPVKREESRSDGGYFAGIGNNNYGTTKTSGNAFNFDELKKSLYEETYGSYENERKQYDSPVEKKVEIDIVKHEPDENLYTLPDPIEPVIIKDVSGRAPIINGDSVEDETERVEDFTAPGSISEPEIKRAPIIVGSTVMADEPFVKEDDKNDKKEESASQKPNLSPIIRASRYEEDIRTQSKSVDESDKDKNSAPDNAHVVNTQTRFVEPEVYNKQNDVNNRKIDNGEIFEKEKKDVVPGVKTENKTEKVIQSNDLHVELDNDVSVTDEPIIDGTYSKEKKDDYVDESLSFDVDKNESNFAEAETDYPKNDDIIPDDELNNEEYKKLYGHPKFVDVSEEDSERLSDEFEKNTTSFRIIDEVEDASENVALSNVATATETPKVSKTEESIIQKTEKPKKPYKYTPPSMDLLTTESTIPKINPEVYAEKKALLEETLENLGIPAKVMGITVGPTVTRYELNMPTGMSVKKIENCEQDIRYGLACKGKIRIESPIPGKKAVGIEVPNDENALVALKDILDSKEFKTSTSPLTVSLGKDIQGKVMVAKIDKMPHLLIAGTTGSGKSACLNSLIISLLYKSSPEDVKIILVDPKRVEFTAYGGLPHMMISDAITESAQAINAFKWAREEMERRYKVLQTNRVRNISEYNALNDVKTRVLDKMPYIVVIVDEFADLMIGTGTDKKRELENLISSIAGKARAAGIHLILATQRPSAEVITGTIKSNLPCRISFAVSNQTNSRIILDKVGAESLLGKGDMLYAPQENPDGIRIQGAYIETQEVIDIVEQIKANNQCEFDDEFEKALVEQKEENDVVVENDGDNMSDAGYDKDLPDIVRMVIKTGQASGAMIQRRFSIGYMRAAKIVDQMEKFNFIGPHNGSKPREVYVTKEKFKEFFGEEFDED